METLSSREVCRQERELPFRLLSFFLGVFFVSFCFALFAFLLFFLLLCLVFLPLFFVFNDLHGLELSRCGFKRGPPLSSRHDQGPQTSVVGTS